MRRRSLARRLVFALIPAGILFAGLEIGLRWVGAGAPADAPALAAAGAPRSYEQTDAECGAPYYLRERGAAGVVRHVANPARVAGGFHDQAFPREPDDGEVRLFAMGGSTTFGIPFENREAGFPARLERVLAAREPAIRWRLINAAVPGMDSRFFPEQADELLSLGADGLVIYAGNNELLGTLRELCASPCPGWLARTAGGFATVRAGRRLWEGSRDAEEQGNPEGRPPDGRPPDGRPPDMFDCMQRTLEAELAAAPGIRGGGAAGADPTRPRWPARTDGLYLRTVERFASNLDAVAVAAAAADVPVWLAVPAVNLQAPPERAPGEPPDDAAARAQVHVDEARRRERSGDVDRAGEAWRAAVDADPTHADALHGLGSWWLAQGDAAAARPLLQRAVDRDLLGKRATSHLQAVTRDVCARHAHLTCVDVLARFEEASATGVPGDTLFVDACHPVFGEGVELITHAFADAIAPAVAAGRAR